MTKYLALMGMGMNMRNSSALGNIIPKANSMPNTAPEAPMVMMLLRTSRVWDHPIIDSVLSGSDTGNHVENKEAFSSPHRFEGTSEDENREHVEENMPERIWVVHEHVGYHLCGVETVGLEIV